MYWFLSWYAILHTLLPIQIFFSLFSFNSLTRAPPIFFSRRALRPRSKTPLIIWRFCNCACYTREASDPSREWIINILWYLVGQQQAERTLQKYWFCGEQKSSISWSSLPLPKLNPRRRCSLSVDELRWIARASRGFRRWQIRRERPIVQHYQFWGTKQVE